VKLASVARRAGWGVADQALSSLTNFLLGVLVARATTPTDFGAFSLVFAAYAIALNVPRALASEPMTVRYSGADEPGWRRAAASSTGTAVAIGVVLGVACLGVGAIGGGAFGSGLLALAISMPGLLLQDTWRLAFFAQGRARRAFVNDLAWTLFMIPAVGLVVLTGATSVFNLTLAWGLSATAAALIGVVQARLLPRPLRTLTWLREQWDLAPKFLGEFLVLAGGSQLSSFLIGAIAGLAAVGAIRGAQILLGPAYVLTIGTLLVGLPEAVRLFHESRERLRQAVIVVSAGLGLATLAWGAVMFFLPQAWGVALLGDTWTNAHRVLIPASISYATLGGGMGAAIGLRAMAAATESLRARTLSTVVQIVGGVVGAWSGGMLGAAWGLAAGGAIGAALYWITFRRAMARHERGRTDEEAETSTAELLGEIPKG
jgi:O-antigen/teichoic acid export membrane protein